MRKYYFIGLILFLFQFLLSGENIKITIISNPPLPLENLIKDRNPGFEDGLKYWVLPKEIPGEDEIKISNDAYKGNHSLYIKSKKGLGVYQILTGFLSPEIIKPGECYIISCWVKAGEEINQRGGVYCGAGSSFVIYSSDWKQAKSSNCKIGNTEGNWKKVVGNPMESPEFGKVYVINAGTSYTSGEAWIDEISVTEAFVDLNFKIDGKDIVQIILEDETGKIIFDSGRLPDKTDKFSRTLQVISSFRYKVKVIDDKGEIYVQEYPEN